MTKVYRAAVIGCGVSGRLNDSLRDWTPGKPALSHAGAYRSCPRTELVAAADPDPARREAFGQFWGLKVVCADACDLLQNEAIDVLRIYAPNGLHASILDEAAGRGVKAVLCEKLLALDLAEAQQARQTALNAGRLLCWTIGKTWTASVPGRPAAWPSRRIS